MQVFLFNEILPKRGREIYFSSQKCTPKCKCNSIFSNEKGNVNAPQQYSRQIKKRSREHQT